MDKNIEKDAGPLTYIGKPPRTVLNEGRFECAATLEVPGRFFEKVEYSLDRLEYPRDGDDPGYFLVFNQTFRGTERERNGSLKDVKDLITCFGRLGYNIEKENILDDPSKEEIFKKVDSVITSDLTEYNSLLVFIMSHGEDCNQIYSSNDDVFPLEALLQKFGECRGLAGKPKMFVIQACKGKETTEFSDEKKNVPLVPPSTFGKNHEDMVIVYSTVEGRYSYRHSHYGSWLIQEICSNFSAYGMRDDVFTLLTRVIKCISANYYKGSDCSGSVEKQIPVIVSTLSKKFYLNKNKDRNFVNESSRMQKDILVALKDIK